MLQREPPRDPANLPGNIHAHACHNDAKTAANRPPFRKFALAGFARKNTFGV
jgi:hypothetical protein